jgi:hypothetical protein
MSFLDENKAKFDNLKVSLEVQQRDQLRRKANGGNSIVFTYNPDEESQYISKAKEILLPDKFKFISIAELLVKFIDQDGIDNFETYYYEFLETTHVIFNSDDSNTDLMDLIIKEIQEAYEIGLTPILIRTGALYGTGIENVNIMEHKSVINMKVPLVIFYPSKIVDENMYFLNFKPASRYRCNVIE